MTRRIPLLLLAIGLVAASHSWLTPLFPPDEAPHPIESLDDPRLGTVRRALPVWRERLSNPRVTCDLVCLVPDVPAFFAAIATWDESRYFPILIDEPESTERFLDAFRPAKVVRWRSQQSGGDASWAAAATAVARSWSRDLPAAVDDRSVLLARPKTPGLVLSAPDSATLAGAVALAAGRFQGLVRLDLGARGREPIGLEAAIQAARVVERAVGLATPRYAGLGDDCDFLTLAGDWPDRYVIDEGDKRGVCALDDLIGRDLETQERYAYVGRLEGSPAESVYQAMCSLFLQPESVLCFNGYDTRTRPWSDYAMTEAGRVLGRQGRRVEERAGAPGASLEGWRAAFRPKNRHGLLLINSSGGPESFRVVGGGATVADIPVSVPTALYVVHSFSAARPWDTETIAGRWLKNGAFLYFGSLNEPYLAAFRTPALVAQLLDAGAPFAAACAKVPSEDALGTPWRLRLIGDPLYQVLPPGQSQARADATSEAAKLEELRR